MSWFTLALCLGASLRLWRVYEIDVIGEPLRKLADGAPEGWAATLVSCVFCLGFWLSVALVASGYFWGEQWWWVILCASLSVSWLLGQIHPRVEEEKDQV